MDFWDTKSIAVEYLSRKNNRNKFSQTWNFDSIKKSMYLSVFIYQISTNRNEMIKKNMYKSRLILLILLKKKKKEYLDGL